MRLRRLLLPMVVVAAVAPASTVRAQDRMPPIPADKMTEAQKKVVAEALPSGGELPTYLVPLLRSPETKYTRPWDGHYQSALKAGLDEQIAKAIDQDQTPKGMAADEQLLYEFSTQLLRPQVIDAGTYGRMVEKFGEKGVIDAIALVGYYSIMGMTFNASLH